MQQATERCTKAAPVELIQPGGRNFPIENREQIVNMRYGVAPHACFGSCDADRHRRVDQQSFRHRLGGEA